MASWELSPHDDLSERARKLAAIALARLNDDAGGPDAAARDIAAVLDLYRGLDARTAAAAGIREAVAIEGDRGAILENVDPLAWRDHRFGLSLSRWQSLAGRVFWISGAATGYGRTIATALGFAGASLVLSGRRGDHLEAAARQIVELAPAARCLILPLDIADAAATVAAAEILLRQFGRLDGLVCAAALAGNPGTILGMAEPDLRRMLDVNVLGQANLCRAAMPPMINGWGGCRVVLFSSEAAWGFPPGIGVYNLTKAAVNGLGLSLASELELLAPGADSQVNVLEPGEARTEMNGQSAISAFTVCSMALTLLSHPAGGPNGRLFHRDGRHLSYGYVPPWPHSLC